MSPYNIDEDKLVTVPKRLPLVNLIIICGSFLLITLLFFLPVESQYKVSLHLYYNPTATDTIRYEAYCSIPKYKIRQLNLSYILIDTCRQRHSINPSVSKANADNCYVHFSIRLQDSPTYPYKEAEGYFTYKKTQSWGNMLLNH